MSFMGVFNEYANTAHISNRHEGICSHDKMCNQYYSLRNAIFSLEDPKYETLMQYAFRTHARAEIDKLKKCSKDIPKQKIQRHQFYLISFITCFFLSV